MPLTLSTVCFHREYALLLRHWDELVVTTTYALKHGKLTDLLLVDATGMAVRVENAKKLHSVGPWRGYNIFLNQTIKVELNFAGEPFPISLVDFKHRLFRSFADWHGWSAGNEVEELRAQIERATSVPEIFDLLFSL